MGRGFDHTRQRAGHRRAYDQYQEYAVGKRAHQENMQERAHGFASNLSEQGHNQNIARDTHQNELGADWRDFLKSQHGDEVAHRQDVNQLARDRLNLDTQKHGDLFGMKKDMLQDDRWRDMMDRNEAFYDKAHGRETAERDFHLKAAQANEGKAVKTIDPETGQEVITQTGGANFDPVRGQARLSTKDIMGDKQQRADNLLGRRVLDGGSAVPQQSFGGITERTEGLRQDGSPQLSPFQNMADARSRMRQNTHPTVFGDIGQHIGDSVKRGFGSMEDRLQRNLIGDGKKERQVMNFDEDIARAQTEARRVRKKLDE